MPIQCPDGKGVKDILAVDGLGNQMSIKEVWLSDENKVLTKRWSKCQQLQYCIVPGNVALIIDEFTPGRFEFEFKVQITDASKLPCCVYGTEYFYATFYNSPYDGEPYRVHIRHDNVEEDQGANLTEPTSVANQVGPNDVLWPYYPTKLFEFEDESNSFVGRFYSLDIWMADSAGVRQWKVVELVPVLSGGKVGLQDLQSGKIYYPTKGELQPGPAI